MQCTYFLSLKLMFYILLHMHIHTGLLYVSQDELKDKLTDIQQDCFEHKMRENHIVTCSTTPHISITEFRGLTAKKSGKTKCITGDAAAQPSWKKMSKRKKKKNSCKD